MRIFINIISIFFFVNAFIAMWIPSADIDRVQAMMLVAIFINLIGKEFEK